MVRALHALATAGVVLVVLSGSAAYAWLVERKIPVLPLSSAVSGFVPAVLFFLMAFNGVAAILLKFRGRSEREAIYRACGGLAGAILLSCAAVFFILTQCTNDPAIGSLMALYLVGPFFIFPIALGLGAILGSVLGILFCGAPKRADTDLPR